MGFCTEMVCDVCTTCITRTTIMTKKDMIRIARNQGWSVGKYHLCPDCKKKRSQLIKDGWLN